MADGCDGENATPGVVLRRVCAGCGSTVPAGMFCGCCGAELDRPGDRLHLLRPRVFVVAPGEHVAMPTIMSSVFPHLPKASRVPFRTGMALLLIGLVGGCMSRLGCTIASDCFGNPFLLHFDTVRVPKLMLMRYFRKIG